MGKLKLHPIQGGIFALIYCLAFVDTWFYSVSQWFLPAGIRACALIFLPYRFWPYIFAGDAAAMLLLRIPLAYGNVEKYSLLWAYVSPFLLAPLNAMLVFIWRQLQKNTEVMQRQLPWIALSLSIWMTICSMAVNHALSGSVSSNSMDNFVRFSTGQYLGILIMLLPIAVWVYRNDGVSRPKHLIAHTALASVFVTITAYAVASGAYTPTLRQFMLLLLIAPAVVLTKMHGWRGAALSASIVSLAMGLTLPESDEMSARDVVTLVPQQVFAVVATALYVLGFHITRAFDKARKFGIAEQDAWRAVKFGYQIGDRDLEKHMAAAVNLQALLKESWRDLIETMKASGQSARAMELMRQSETYSRQLDEHASAIFPFDIGYRGLFSTLQRPSFSGVWAGGTPIRYQLHGRDKHLSTDMQLATYRSICSAVSLLYSSKHDHYQLKVRAWQGSKIQGVVVSITAVSSGKHQSSQALPDSLELAGRIKAHGGILRHRHANNISFLLCEAASDPQSEFGALITQASPSLSV